MTQDTLSAENQAVLERVYGPKWWINSPEPINRLLEAVRLEERSKGWKPIETAPTGAPVLTFGGSRTEVTREVADGEWWNSGQITSHPTHWQPLPSPPVLGGGEK